MIARYCLNDLQHVSSGNVQSMLGLYGHDLPAEPTAHVPDTDASVVDNSAACGFGGGVVMHVTSTMRGKLDAAMHRQTSS